MTFVGVDLLLAVCAFVQMFCGPSTWHTVRQSSSGIFSDVFFKQAVLHICVKFIFVFKFIPFRSRWLVV